VTTRSLTGSPTTDPSCRRILAEIAGHRAHALIQRVQVPRSMRHVVVLTELRDAREIQPLGIRAPEIVRAQLPRMRLRVGEILRERGMTTYGLSKCPRGA
jgi:hypothetical protein